LDEEWLEMLKEFTHDFSALPDWAKKIMLRDIRTSFKSRLLIIQKVMDLPRLNNNDYKNI